MANKNILIQSQKNKVNTLLRHGQFKEAETILSDICRQSPRDIEAWFLLATIKGRFGKFEDVIRCSERILAVTNGHAGAYVCMANALASLDRLDESMPYYLQALRLTPADARIHNNYGNALLLSGRHDEAIASFQRAIKYQPRYAPACLSLGNALLGKGDTERAANFFRQAIQIQPGWVEAHCRLGAALRLGGKLDEALAVYADVLRLEPGNPEALAGQANIHQRRRETERAHDLLQGLVARNALNPAGMEVYARICRQFDCCSQAIDQANRMLAQGNLGAADRGTVHYALGFIHDASGNFDEAFAHFRQANSFLHYSFDRQGHTEFINRIAKIFCRENRERFPRAGNRSGQPVFIVGMPRSGTSLVEQILASHPRVHGAGELTEIGKIANAVMPGLDPAFPGSAEPLSQKRLDTFAEQYLAHLNNLARDAVRVTDKFPSNFLWLGLIAMLFPSARVIHCRRDPLDICLSVYFQSFSGGLPYATDLADIAHYYREYRRLMDHWRATLDISLLEIDYEGLVANLEAVSRNMVAFCGLEWDNRCLSFHNTERYVSTASYEQVRQPIYNRSVGRWKNYERHIGPLREALGQG